MTRTGTYGRCPYCGNNYQLVIPKGGDGSAIYFPLHKRRVGLRLERCNKQICPGSNKEYIEKTTEAE